ncbi:EAL domain-containing protein [Pirellulaceae bacterium SH501]
MNYQSIDCANSCWTLVEFGPGEQQKRTIALQQRPLVVGRTSDADVCIPEVSVSKKHARISFDQEGMWVEDLRSTNGTFLNCNPVHRSLVCEGDLLQFGNALFRIGKESRADAGATHEQGILPWAQTLLHFDKLLTERAIIPFFQPIITMKERDTIGHELLVRSKLEGLTTPANIFGAADRLGQNATLSEMIREEGLLVASRSNHFASNFFLNTHPSEVVNDRLLESLVRLRQQFPDSRITLEIHEASVTDPRSIGRLRDVLTDLSMQLSYDDFGAGQGRLLELGEQPPDVLKFDMQLIRDIDKAPSSRQELLAALVRLARDLGTTTLAEGVETEAEHVVCAAMGFELGQGYFYGLPAPFNDGPSQKRYACSSRPAVCANSIE